MASPSVERNDHPKPERMTQLIHDAGGRDVASGDPIQPDRQVGSLPGTSPIGQAIIVKRS
jgi:hypothetical protein